MDEIFSKIAKENNTSKEQVEEDISEALNQAIKNSKGNPEAEIFWKEAFKNKKNPTPEEIIKMIAARIIKKKDNL